LAHVCPAPKGLTTFQCAGAEDFKTVSGNKPNKELMNRPAHGDEQGFARTHVKKEAPTCHRHL